MSVRKDWSANERRLQGAYDDISSGRYKVALNEVTRFIKKTPGSQPALVLRAFLLNKLGQPTAEVLKVWHEVEKTGELSPRSMWFAQLLMRSIDRSDILLNLYTKHWEARPDSMELGHQVVTLSTACWDTSLICSSSRKIFNLSKTATWARVAAWAEWVDKTSSQDLPEHGFQELAPPNSLRTAAVLLSTTRKDVPSSEILWLHIQILLGSGQEGDALALVREEGLGGGGIARNWWRIKTVQEVLKRLLERGEKERLKEVVKEELEEFARSLKDDEDMQRNWANYDHIIQLVTRCPEPSNITAVKDLFQHLHAGISSKERAPALALLHLDSKLRHIQADSTSVMDDEEYKTAVEAYWRRWRTKGVVVDDLAGQWDGKQAVLAAPLQAWSEEGHTNVDDYLARKHARLLLFRLKADGWEPTEEEFQATWKYYVAGERYGLDLPDTDIRPADDIGLAAVQILLHSWASSGDERHLFRAALCLRRICEDSPASAHARYLLIRIYRLLGAPSLVVKPLENLKLAEIQLDTLLHIVTDQASIDLPLGQISAVVDSYRDRAEAMYNRTRTDLPEYTKQALENESYSQIHFIRRLRSTLSTSLPRTILATEAQLSALLSKAKPPADMSAEFTPARNANEGEDTRDWALMPTLVGRRPIQDVTALGGSSKESIEAWCQVLRGMEQVGISPDFKMGSTLPNTEALSPVERVAVEEIWQLVKAAHTTFAATAGNATPDVEQAITSISNIGQASVQFATGDVRCRWERIQAVVLLLRLLRVINVLYIRAVGNAQAKGKSKKVQTSSAITDLANALGAAAGRIGQDLLKVAQLWEGAEKQDAAVDWADLAGDPVQVEFAKAVGQEIIESRRMAMDNLWRLMKEVGDSIGKK